MWKAVNVEDYPTKVNKITPLNNAAMTRASTNGKLKECGKTALSQATLINDAIKMLSQFHLFEKCFTLKIS